ncbi:polysaccharide deacetylase family protein [Paenarthrobacter sp. S56]|uniref:polysaccharide deacetylase family protein n=1 Tax=Paenarthrobacter sp. S56 TaxID=3138179 RepID=UPI003219B880
MAAVVVSASVVLLVAAVSLALFILGPGGPQSAVTTAASPTSSTATTAPGSPSQSAEAAPGTATGTAPATLPPQGPGPATTSGVPPAPPRESAAPEVPAGLLGQDLTTVPGSGNNIALTFDAGANAAGLQSILSTLATKQVAGTFFLTGTWAAANPAGVARIVASGHRVGNHSMTHPSFTQLSDTAITGEIRDGEAAIIAAGGSPRPLFRFPFGDRDARTINDVNSLGYVPVRWTVDTLGWKGTSGGMSRTSVTQRVLGSLQPGAIILMHLGSNPDDGSTLDADALPAVIDGIRAAGYGFVTLDALFGP